jgi:hypothetical protein
MGPFVRAACTAASLAVMTACASGAAPPRTASLGHDPILPVAASPPAPAAERAANDVSATTGLTGATVSMTESEPPSEWTDARIVAVLVTASDGDANQASAALELSHSPSILRFARHMQLDDRVLGERVRALATRLGADDSPTRLEVDVERAGFVQRMHEVAEEKIDAIFLRAQTEQCSALVDLIDHELLGAAKDPELVSILRDVRAGAAQHLGTVEEMAASPRLLRGR